MEEQRQPLTIAQRQKKARQMKRLAPKLARFRKIRAKRMADREKLLVRAQKAARNVIRKKVAGQRGADYSALSPAEKMTIDKLVIKKSAVIQKLAKRLLPKVRKSEMERLKRARSGGTEQNESFDFDREFEILFESEERKKEVEQDPDVKDIPGTQPKKYFKGLSDKEKEARAKQFARQAKKSDDDPDAYKAPPSNKDAETKPSKHTKKYRAMFGEQDAVKRAKEAIKREKESDKAKHDAMLDRARTQDTQAKNRQTEEYEMSEDASGALKKKSEKSGIPVGILRQVYNRGMAAWKTGHRPGASQQQWAFARVNSFITKGKGTWGGADKDLAGKVKKEEVELDEARAKQAVAGNKVQKLITALGMSYKGKNYDEIDMELVSIDNSSQVVTFRILHPREHIGDVVKIPFKSLRRGRYMATDTSKINEACWDGYRQAGMKKKGDKMVPNCVPESDIKELSPQLKKRYVDKATSDVRLTKRNILIGKDVGATDVVKKDKGRLQKRRIGIARATEPKGSRNIFDSVNEEPKKKKLNAMLGVPTARPSTPPEKIEEMPRWLLEPLSKITNKRGYEAAKKVLKDVLDRKKKEAGRKGLQHSVEYYAAQIAKQFQGVDARVLADMVTEQPEKLDAPEIGTDIIRKRYADMTPGQVNESYVFAKDEIKIQGAFEHYPTTDFQEDYLGWVFEEETLEEAEYQGRKVKLNDPFRTPKGPKKFSVYVKNDKGNVVKVNFGDPNMEIKRDDPERRKSFRARHDCDNKTDKTQAGYWSCQMWKAGKSVSDLD
jgi:hypothetical protein